MASTTALEFAILLLWFSATWGSCLATESEMGKKKYKVEAGFIREGHTYNDPSKLITSSPDECCELCVEEERCKSWTRNRHTGACAFKDFIVEIRRNYDFDTGVLGGVPALSDPPLDDQCIVELGVDFKGGDLDPENAMETDDAGKCCRMCENEQLCYSWTWKRSSKRCFLKGSVPDRVPNNGTDGGIIF